MNILITIGTHGNEKIGRRVAAHLKNVSVTNGRLDVIVANERAFNLNKRCIDQDLNRSFPGKKNGNYEQRRAYALTPLIRSADIVVDLHSTTSELKDAVIVTRLTEKTRTYLDVISPKYVLVMRATKNNALISGAKVGLAFEYGKDKDPKTILKVTAGIRKLLAHLNMVAPIQSRKNKTVPPIFFDVYETVPKPAGAKLMKSIKNYSLIQKGQTYATIDGTPIRATRDFYPILFGESNYETIFGFAASRMD